MVRPAAPIPPWDVATLELWLKQFKKETQKRRTLTELRRHEFYLKSSQKKHAKRATARKSREKAPRQKFGPLAGGDGRKAPVVWLGGGR